MAQITPHVPHIYGEDIAFAASNPGGDEIKYAGGVLVIEFVNGHSSSITIEVRPTVQKYHLPGAGPVQIPTRSLLLSPGSHGIFAFVANDIKCYLNGNRRLPLSYVNGNGNLLVRVFQVLPYARKGFDPGEPTPPDNRLFWIFNSLGVADLSGSDSWDSSVTEVWHQ